MVNMFKIKEIMALCTAAMLTSIMFYMGLAFYGLLGGLLFMFVGAALGVLLGMILLKNPFSALLKGQGVLTFNMDSTGVLRPFISTYSSPYIKSVWDGKELEDIFDRDAIFNLARPEKAGQGGFFDLKTFKDVDVLDKDGKPTGAKTKEAVKTRCWGLILTEEEFNKSRFGMFQYPVLIWNNQVKSLITKDFLSEVEKEMYAEHSILYLNNKVKELATSVKDFGRYIVETLKPKGSLFSNSWVIVIIFIIIVIMVIMFAPAILNSLKGMGTVAGAATSGVGGGAFTPR